MCGILGGWVAQPASLPEQRVADALQSLRRRGPNDQGAVFEPVAGGLLVLGHTRLSIIDLTSGGHQPMDSANGRYAIVFNGEIYNYRELRMELQAAGFGFRSQSDTEVLLAAWQHWGQACLPRLVGMFAMVVHDRQRGQLVCARDAFGIKPFLYCRDGGKFLFASEAGALATLVGTRPKADWQRAYDYLVHGDYDSGPRSFVQGFLHLMPGHVLTLDVASGQMDAPRAWWQPNVAAVCQLGFADAAAVVRDKFLANVRLHLRSDVPLGAALSGGIDSSAIVCAMRLVEPDLPINTFSYIASGSTVSEELWVDQVNHHVGAIAHKVVLGPRDLLADLDDLLAAQGEPFGSTSIYAQYCVYRSAREHGITVTLDGQGVDEAVAGYNGYPGQRLRSLLDGHDYHRAWLFLCEWAKWPGRSRVEGLKRLANQLASGPLQTSLRRLNGMPAKPQWINTGALEEAGVRLVYPYDHGFASVPQRRVVSELLASLTNRGLPGLLRHGDRNSMRFSVESRVPFLTIDMVEFLLSLPEEYLISASGETKSIFRAAMRGIVPDAILDRRDKIGFATPEKQWIAAIAGTVRGWLNEDWNLPFLNQREILREFDQIMAGTRPFSWVVWRWINYVHWHKRTC